MTIIWNKFKCPICLDKIPFPDFEQHVAMCRDVQNARNQQWNRPAVDVQVRHVQVEETTVRHRTDASAAKLTAREPWYQNVEQADPVRVRNMRALRMVAAQRRRAIAQKG